MAVAPSVEAAEIIREEGGEILKLCYQCGTCTAVCPWNTVRDFLVRQIIHQAQLGIPDFESEDMWLCVTCKSCVDRCPRGVEIIDVWRTLRKVIVDVGVGGVPDSLRLIIKSISSMGNPQGEERDKRLDWTKDLDIKTFTQGTDVLYYPCCYIAIDPQLQKVARATASVLKTAGVDFGILGSELSCCGESVRKAGSEALFQSLAENNIKVFNDAGVKKILTTSPHCYHTFKNEYPELSGNYEVIHITQYLAELIENGNLTLSKELNKKVTFHDSCYLGRHNDIYDEPRRILQSIPGLELVEMLNTGENSLCCGGGGGRIWEDTKKEERFSDIRLEQAIQAEADILATTCPYCMVNFEDSVLTTDKGDSIEVKDIVEMVQEAIS